MNSDVDDDLCCWVVTISEVWRNILDRFKTGVGRVKNTHEYARRTPTAHFKYTLHVCYLLRNHK